MRQKEGPVAHLAAAIEADLKKRQTNLDKPALNGLADLSATMLIAQSINTSELANALPREVQSNESRYRFINRWLKNTRINFHDAIKPFAVELLQKLSSNGSVVSISFDQTKICNGFECIMLSIRFGERALPLLWKVVETKGSIGFDFQEPLIRGFAQIVPQNVKILFNADRFYGTSALISLMKELGWMYRVRLKGNLILRHQGGELLTGELLELGLPAITDVELNESGVTTNIGSLHEEGHPEAWIIAMECTPTEAKVLDYGLRWACEPLYSDFKSRGFNIQNSHLKHEERIERLLLVIALSCYWAVSIGMDPALLSSQPSKKKLQDV